MAYDLSHFELYKAEMGDYEATFIAVTTTVTGPFCAFHVWQDTIFASGTVFNGSTTDFSAATAPSNLIIRGYFDFIDLVSGKGMAYKIPH